MTGTAVQEMQRHSGSGHKHGASSPERLIVICIPHLGNTACTYVPVRAGWGGGAGAVGACVPALAARRRAGYDVCCQCDIVNGQFAWLRGSMRSGRLLIGGLDPMVLAGGG